MKKESNLQKKKKRSEMSDLERVQDFQRNLYRKAKQVKDYRFYVLYDKIRLKHFLREAFRRVNSKKGGKTPGVDGITCEMVMESGLEQFIARIVVELENETYRPQPVKRKMIPKPNGKVRPLGIPTIKDRVIQMACKMVIEPIFEADFEENSYGFRPKRSSKEAISAIKDNLKSNKTEVYDADLSEYFDTIPHDKLMKLLSLRISDKKVLHLIKMWLKTPIYEDGQLKGGKKNKRGTPQGGVISPLLANIYLHLLDKLVNKGGSYFSKCGIKIVRYADDFVLMGRRIPKAVIEILEQILERMELKINVEKSELVKAAEQSFDFLGFTIRYDKSIKFKYGKYWNIFPSKKSSKRIRGNIKEFLKEVGHYPPERVAEGLNEKIRGWLNYYTIKGVSYTWKCKRDLNKYLRERLWRYYRRKSQRKCKLYRRGAFTILVNQHGLIDPVKY